MWNSFLTVMNSTDGQTVKIKNSDISDCSTPPEHNDYFNLVWVTRNSIITALPYNRVPKTLILDITVV